MLSSSSAFASVPNACAGAKAPCTSPCSGRATAATIPATRFGVREEDTVGKRRRLTEAMKRQRRVLRRTSTGKLRDEIRAALVPDGLSVIGDDVKEWIRSRHSSQRAAGLAKMHSFLTEHEDDLLANIARGDEIDPYLISPRVTEVSTQEEVRLFRYAALHWSIPVSGGFGRRTRFIVRDEQNDKLIGIFALSDPVYNLACRDSAIEWTDDQKRERLYRVLDASVVGAVPPYSLLLGGKLVALCGLARQTLDKIERKYRGRRTVIRRRLLLNPRPVLITTTSALGRSSIYNRLSSGDRQYFAQAGWTKGYGHFQLPGHLFERLLELMDDAGIKKARSYRYGEGPNWKLRAVRMGLQLLGIDTALLRHGIAREVYLAPTASNWQEILRGEQTRARWFRDDLGELASYFRERWAVPRASRYPDYRSYDPETFRLLGTEGTRPYLSALKQ